MKRYVKIELPDEVVKELMKQCTGLDFVPFGECFSIEGFFIKSTGGTSEFHVYDSTARQENIRSSNLD